MGFPIRPHVLTISAAVDDLELHQIDIEGAYLNGELERKHMPATSRRF